MKKATAIAVVFAVTAASAAAAEPFSWTGTYQGFFVCDNVTAGVPSNFGRSMTLHIHQDSDVLNVEIDSVVDASVGGSLYHGLVTRSPAGDIESGFLEVCRPSFPYKELVRIFPAGTTGDGFGFSADTVFVTDGLPGIEGKLVVESCKWSLDRIKSEVPDFETCPTPPTLRP